MRLAMAVASPEPRRTHVPEGLHFAGKMRLWQGLVVLVLVPAVLCGNRRKPANSDRNDSGSHGATSSSHGATSSSNGATSSSHGAASSSHNTASSSHGSSSGSHSGSGGHTTTYLGWDLFDVASIAPFFNLENYGLPSHLDLLSFNTGTGTTVLAVAEDKMRNFMQKLTDAGVSFQNTLQDISQMFVRPLTYDHTRSLRRGDATFDRYMHYEEIVSYIEDLPAKYPDEVQVEEIGRSVEDRPIYIVSINRRNDSSSAEKPVIFVEAGTYAREWVSPASALYLVERLLEDSPSLSQDAEWRVIPLLNPDGYVYSWRYDRLWKKNRAPSSVPECFGVDLNKNFDLHWGEIGSSINPCSNMYHGQRPFSEPETKALRGRRMEVENRTKAYVSLHSFGQTLHYPVLYDDDVNRTSLEELDRIAVGMAARIEATSGANYTVRSPEPFIIGGTSENWAASRGVPYVYTLELRDKGETVFHLPEELIASTGEDVWAAMKYLVSHLEE
ncbi:carboxypeptidase B-like [Penaeus japonicus]|uniref:carboxypeptidase B-like n=1 Tax=Penaeus japonicus TaxID=27405 RepID=UPI001C714D64|nr:carboxypeptidase B-like [Penaeus japonicus]